METQIVDGITLVFDAREQEAADLIGDAAARSVRLIQKCWGLEAPKTCRVYVMTSWLHFIFHSASWPMRVLYAATLPFWYTKTKKLWPSIAGCTQTYQRRPAIGVKPPRLLDTADRAIGQKIYIQEDDTSRKVQGVVCHEMAHAFSAHLKLPLWLNEGIAMVTVDRFFERPTVKPETIGMLQAGSLGRKPAEYRHLFRMKADETAYQYVRGYWLTRYLEDRCPDLMRSLLSHRRRVRSLEQQIATELGIQPSLLWREINAVVVNHFVRGGTEQEKAVAQIRTHPLVSQD